MDWPSLLPAAVFVLSLCLSAYGWNWSGVVGTQAVTACTVRNTQPDQQCEQWAVKGECDVNVQYMSSNCAASCGVVCLYESATVRVVARGRMRTMKTADVKHPNDELGAMLCREDAATCISGERCPCDPRPLPTDLVLDDGRGASVLTSTGERHFPAHTSMIVDLLQERLSTRAAAGSPTPRLLIVGLGTGLIPTSLLAALPQLGLVVDVVEIDENVVTAARTGFGFADAGRMLVADAGDAVHTLPTAAYDAVVVDCMVGQDGVGTIPAACFSDSFAARLVSLLRPRGLLAEWVWAHQRKELLERLQSQGRRFTSIRSIPHVEAPWRRGDDSNSHECEAWAATGECTANRAYMVAHCPRSCYLRFAQADLKGQAAMELNSWLVLDSA